MLKYVGFFIVSFAIFALGAEYSKKEKKGAVLSSEFLRFCTYAKREIFTGLRTVREIARGFESEPLAECGFLPRIADGEGLSETFYALHLPLDDAERDLLGKIFSSLASSHASYGIGEADGRIEELRAYVSEKEMRCALNVKLSRTLTATACAGFLLLLI